MIADMVALAAMTAAAIFLVQLSGAEPVLPRRSRDAHRSSPDSMTARTFDADESVHSRLDVIGSDGHVLHRYAFISSVVVGSSATCDIYLPIDGIEDHHAQLIPMPGNRLRVEGLAQSTGIYIADEPLVLRDIAEPGELISLGAVSLRLRTSVPV
ncbi:FHA domain-containing protein [Rhodococcus globerulus]|uniref:FHA domain-containing protein n=1 Tax=Rhodococcus globerulus TaxID=33008 RepID=UPI003019247F